MDLNLNNKIALITGASRGLGFATARALAIEGCQVAINSRDADNLDVAMKKIAAQTESTVRSSVVPADTSRIRIISSAKIPAVGFGS